MINGAHVILYTKDAEADRGFIRDTLGFAGVDAGDGWLIFQLPPAEIAVHPTDGETKQEFYLMCDDVEAVLAALSAKGVEVSRPVSDEGWGLLASIRLPSGSDLPLYEPRHPVAYDLPANNAAGARRRAGQAGTLPGAYCPLRMPTARNRL